MKKILSIGLCLICLTGCSKKITCTKESKAEDYATKSQITYSYEKESLNKIEKKNIIVFQTKNDAKDYYNQYNKTAEFQKEYGTDEEKKIIKKNQVYQKGKKFILEINYNEKEITEEAKLNEEFSLTQENYIKYFENKGYKCK